MATTKMGKVQLKIMGVLWSRGQATAREITDELNQLEPIAHSTVQTLLRGLMEKQAVAYEQQGRTFVFRPLVREEKVRVSATRDLISHVFDGSVKELISHLLTNERVSRKELDEIKNLIDEHQQKK